MRSRPGVSVEARTLALAPLLATLTMGVLYLLAQDFLAHGQGFDVTLFCIALFIIPASSYLYGHRVLSRILGSGLDRTAEFARSVADGTHQNFDAGSAVVSVEIMNFLRDWLTNHIMKTDKKLGQSLGKLGVK